MRNRLTLSTLAAATLALTTFISFAPAAHAADTNQPHHVRWESAIARFEARDKTNPPPLHAVLLIGSSSIVKWTNAPAQFPGHNIINRGFGGSELRDSVAFIDRIVTPYEPKVVMLYAGDNDLAAGQKPEQVFAAFKEFDARIHKASPRTPIVFISIKPSPSRAKLLPKVRETNRLIHDYITKDKRLHYVDVFTNMLTPGGEPREELFVKDRLHMNEDGYKLWAGIIKPLVDKLDAPAAK